MSKPSATTQSPSPLQGCGLISLAMYDGHAVQDSRRKWEGYCSNVGPKMCVTQCAIILSCRPTSDLPPPNGDANTLGPRYIISTPTVHCSTHEHTQPPARDYPDCHNPIVDAPSPIPPCMATNPAPNAPLADIHPPSTYPASPTASDEEPQHA